jgi:hypothetical protein
MFSEPQRKVQQTHPPGGRREPSPPDGAVAAPSPAAPGLAAVQRRANGGAGARAAQAYRALLNPPSAPGGEVAQLARGKRRGGRDEPPEPKRRRLVGRYHEDDGEIEIDVVGLDEDDGEIDVLGLDEDEIDVVGIDEQPYEQERRDGSDEDDVSGSERERDDRGVELDEAEASAMHVGIGTFNINHLGNKSEKKEPKLQAIRHLFGSNEWLELLALQEVNDPAVLDELGEDVEVLGKGPLMRTVGVKPKGKKGGRGGADAEDGGNQEATRELYPLLARAGSGWKLEGTQVFGAGDDAPEDWTDGEELVWRDRTAQGAVEQQIEAAKLGIRRNPRETRDAWFNRMEDQLGTPPRREGRDKKKARLGALKLLRARKKRRNEEDGKTRPVVIYRLRNENDGRRLNVGVVHTTPSGQEFARENVFAQVSGFLEYMNEAAGGEDEDNASWVLLGDFYLTPEAEVTGETNSKNREKRDSFGVHFPGQELLGEPPEAKYPNLELAHAISASNWPTMHHKHGERTKVQIADFMIVSNNFQERTAGLFDRFGSGVWPVDPDHHTLEAWMPTTDHAPVGGMLSSERNDDRVEEVRRQAEERAFPPHIRALADPGMLEPGDFADNTKEGVVPLMELDENDAMFFLTPEEMEHVPFGDYNQFTHDIVGMAAEIRRRAPEIDTHLAPMALEAALADNTTMGDVLFDLQHLPSNVYGMVQDALPDVWRHHHRYDG